MEKIQIFSGNIPAIVCTYFNKNRLKQSHVCNINSGEPERNQQDNFEHGSIAVFDPNYIQNRFFNFVGEPSDFLNIKHNSLDQNYVISDHTSDKNQILGSNINGFIEDSPWNGRIDVFEQSNNYGEYSNNYLSFLKRLLGEKNIHDTIFNKQKYPDSNSPGGLLNNSYGLNFINSNFETVEIMESIRHQLEMSDRNRVIHLSTEVDSIYSNISNEIAEFLDEEAPHSYKPSLSLLVNKKLSMNDLNLNKILNFANLRFLIDQSKVCDDIWLMELNYIENLVKKNVDADLNFLDALSFVVDQTSIEINLNDKHINPTSVIGRSVSHPFRNIAIFNPHKVSSDSDKANVMGSNFKSLCLSYFLDMCQSEYIGLDFLDKSEIVSIINGNPYIPGKETEKIINYLSINTRKIIHNVNNSISNKNVFPISIINTIYNLKNCKLINDLFECMLRCKQDSKFLNSIRNYYNLESEEINLVFESVSTWFDI